MHPAISAPAVFFFLNKDVYHHNSWREISSRILQQRLPPSFESYLAFCVESLPPEAHVSYLGLMMSRPQDPVRLVSKLPSEQILPYLLKIGWEGSVDNLEPLLSELSMLTDFVCLSYDVLESVRPRVGLECYLDRQPKYESRWWKLLERMVAMDLCSCEKKDALLRWPGYTLGRPAVTVSVNRNSDTGWNNCFLNPGAFIRRLSHLKFLYSSCTCIEAKAYLEMIHYG
jgi:hypothetical protein